MRYTYRNIMHMNEIRFLTSYGNIDPPAAAYFTCLRVFNQTLIACVLHLHRSSSTINTETCFCCSHHRLRYWRRNSHLPTNTAYCMFSAHSQQREERKKMSPSFSGAGPCAFASATRISSLLAVTRLIRQNI